MTGGPEGALRIGDLKRFYSLLDMLQQQLAGARRLSHCSGRMPWPERGVYFLMEPGEIRTDSGTGSRVVRVGTHALAVGQRSTLWSRLYQHRGPMRSGAGNHRGSIFRDLVGGALIKRDVLDYPDWQMRDRHGSAPRAIRERERSLERAVSKIIGRMYVLWLAVDDQPGPGNRRGYIERNAIALLSNYNRPAIDPPSHSWLGCHCDPEKVRGSGLWNSDHVEERYNPAFLDTVENLIDKVENAT